MGILEGILELATEETYLDGYRRRDRVREYHREVLAFRLGDEDYAADILRLREILKPRPITEVPRAPAFVPGILSVRGEVMPVIDLRKRLRLAPGEPSRTTRILVALKDGEPMGLLVDAVRQVVKLRNAEIEPPPHTIGGIEEFVAGIGRPAEGVSNPRGSAEQARPSTTGMLILLNMDAVLTFDVGQRFRGERVA